MLAIFFTDRAVTAGVGMRVKSKLVLENNQTGGSLSPRATIFVTVHEAGKHREETAVKDGRSSDRGLTIHLS